ALQCEAIKFFTLKAILVGDHLCAGELTELQHAIALLDSFAEGAGSNSSLGGQKPGRSHRHASHALDAGRDHEILGAGHHGLRGEVDSLLRAPTLTVDRDRRDTVRKTRSQDRVAAYVKGLLADLADASHDHVF